MNIYSIYIYIYIIVPFSSRMRFEWSVDSAVPMQKCVTTSVLLVKLQILLAYETVDFFSLFLLKGIISVMCTNL